MWDAQDIAIFALICGCAFLLFIVTLPFVLRAVEVISERTRRSRSRPLEAEQASMSEQTPQLTTMTDVVVERYSLSSRVNRLALSPLPLPTVPTRISSPKSLQGDVEDPFKSPIEEEDDISLSYQSSGPLSAPITPNSALSSPESPIRVIQSPFEVERPVSTPSLSSLPSSPPPQSDYSDERPAEIPESPPPPSASSGQDSVQGRRNLRRLRRLPSFMSTTTMNTLRSLRTQPPCYQEDVPFDELRLAGGPNGAGGVYADRSDSR